MSASAAFAADVVGDGGFEAGSNGDSPDWTEASNVFGTPLCTHDACTGVGAHNGSVWAWFGGTADAEDSWLQQSVEVPAGRNKLVFFLWIDSYPGGGGASLTVSLGGRTLATYDGSNASSYASGYTRIALELPADLTGAQALRFQYSAPDPLTSEANFDVDDVSIISPPKAPVIGEAHTVQWDKKAVHVIVHGNSASPGIVRVFANANCSGPVFSTVPADQFPTTGAGVLMPIDMTAQISAMVVDGSESSDCSASFPFLQISPVPQTKIVKAPPKSTTSTSARIVFAGVSWGSSTFKCKLDKHPAKSCTSPLKLKNLAPGKHKLAVTAVSMWGKADPHPAVVKWKVLSAH